MRIQCCNTLCFWKKVPILLKGSSVCVFGEIKGEREVVRVGGRKVVYG
jgi:hypothetical protein